MIISVLGAIALLALASCKTVEGAGEDISNLGKGITETSQSVQDDD
jgi:predicted small secreted protein